MTNKTNRAKEHIICFRVPTNVFNILSVKSAEKKLGKNPHLVARKILLDSLSIDDPKLIKMSINNLNKSIQEVNSLIQKILLWEEFFTIAHYASHPEIPKNEVNAISEKAEKRTKEFFKHLVSVKLGEGNTIIEEVIMNTLNIRNDD
jgi:hypothetical protein